MIYVRRPTVSHQIRLLDLRHLFVKNTMVSNPWLSEPKEPLSRSPSVLPSSWLSLLQLWHSESDEMRQEHSNYWRATYVFQILEEVDMAPGRR